MTRSSAISRFRTVFGNTSKSKQQRTVSDGIEVIQPSTFSILTAQYGFYDTILGKIDDQKPLSVPQKLVQSVVKQTLDNKDRRIKAVPRLPSIIPKLIQTLRDPKAAVIDYIKIINKDNRRRRCYFQR